MCVRCEIRYLKTDDLLGMWSCDDRFWKINKKTENIINNNNTWFS